MLGILLFAALFQFGERPKAPVIQADIQNRSTAALAAAGYDQVAAQAVGRDVTLTGQVADENAVSAVGDAVESVRGVRVVHNKVVVHAPYQTEFCKDESTIYLSGDVPGDDARATLSERARDMFRYREVAESLNARTDSADGFRRFMDEAIISLGQLDAGCITLTDRSLLVKGLIRGERAADALRGRLAELADLHFDIAYELDLPMLSEQALTCQTEANRRISRDESVLFSFDSDTIHEIGRQLLDEVVQISRLCPDVAIQVLSHTDSIGNKDYNVALGERRAEAVVDYLVSKGIAADRLLPVSMGFSQPVADNSSDEGRAANRRIEFRMQENN